MAAVLVLLGLALLAGDFFLYPQLCGISGHSGNTGKNGLWLRYSWYFGKKSAQEELETGKLLRDNQIKYAYFHVLDVTKDGNLRHQKLAEGKRLVQRFHQLAPDTKVIAWVSAGDYYPAHGTDLEKPQVIANMLACMKWLVNDVGFDGIQWDYEPCKNESEGFINLLRQTKAAMPQGKILSVAAPIYYPLPFLWFWSESYSSDVIKNCDQLAIMGYDSGFYTPRAYEWLMSQQLPLLTKIIAQSNPNCRLMMGVPTYGRDYLQSHSETLTMALLGLRKGMENPATDKTYFDGVAPFADYTTDENEWETYRELWLDK